MTRRPGSVLRSFDATAASAAARRETRNREAHLPVIGLYRWWARRTRAVTNAILDAAATELGPVLSVADPFAGGGVIALSALTKGHRVLAQELDPWAARNLAAMATPGDPGELAKVEAILAAGLTELGDPYVTTMADGSPARVTTTLRVATGQCQSCDAELHLYPGALVTRTKRIDSSKSSDAAPAWFACPAGHLHQSPAKQHPCPECGRRVRVTDRYTKGRVVRCWSCKTDQRVADVVRSSAHWKTVLVQRSGTAAGSEISPPTAAELELADPASVRLGLAAIPPGREASPLLRYGYRDFADLYPTRQLKVLDHLLNTVASAPDLSDWARQVGVACVIGCAEFAGHATRWDASYLKPYETISSHRFAVTTLSAEGDPWGTKGRGTIRRRLNAAAKAAVWLDLEGVPRQVRTRVHSDARRPLAQGITVVTGSSEQIPVKSQAIDLVLTDPPYHDDVQYSELSNIFRAWSNDAVGPLPGDVTALNNSGESGLELFESRLLAVFEECRRIVKPEGHLVLSFANRDPDAWLALFSALQRAGWIGCGFEVVHSENESDHAKLNRRACTLDVLLDLTLVAPPSKHRPTPASAPSDELTYCLAAGELALTIGHLRGDWRGKARELLVAQTFLSTRKHSLTA